MEALRLIANPIHLICEKQKHVDNATYNQKEDFNSNIKEILNDKYKKVYLSDLNYKEIIILVDNYIDNILIQRIVNDCLTKLIEDTIDNSDKFDFCLPFD